MEKKHVQLEVLLMTGTSFATGSCIPNTDNPASRNQSEIQRLQEACWNGLLEAMLPELLITPPNGSTLYLWEVKEAQSFLQLHLSEVPLPVDPRETITPQSFLNFQVYN
jgi:hypothetical protein